jgi:putative SOS response-associated peptidase YedK
VIADGFYEWQKRDGGKQPYFIHMRDDGPFAFAGLWARNERFETPIETCTIVTTNANDLLRPLHDRMPVILPPSAWDTWLDPGGRDVPRLQGLLVPAPAHLLVVHPVSTEVNQVRNKGPRLVEPVAAVDTGLAEAR